MDTSSQQLDELSYVCKNMIKRELYHISLRSQSMS